MLLVPTVCTWLITVKLTGKNIFAIAFLALIAKMCGSDPSPKKPIEKSPVVSFAQAKKPIAVEPIPPATTKPKRYVGPAALNVRSSPNGAAIGRLTKGTEVEIYAEQDGWARTSKENETSQWVSVAHLCSMSDCSDIPKWKPAATARVTPAQKRQATAAPRSSSYGCSCSSGTNCYGPRGGRYCITSGGNKRYR